MYFELGLTHILDLDGYDHILYVIALSTYFMSYGIKRLLYLISFFTVGHSIALALATFKLIQVNIPLVEFFIPITIILTSVVGMFKAQDSHFKPSKPSLYFTYFLTLIFGLIHGMGFSNYLRSLLGKTENIVMELFAFNMGVEVGQILVVIAVLMVYGVLSLLLGGRIKYYVLALRLGVIGLASFLTISAKFW